MSTCTASRVNGKIRCTLGAGHTDDHLGTDGRRWREPGRSTLPPPPENVEPAESVITVRHEVAQAMAASELKPAEPKPAKPRKKRRRAAKKKTSGGSA